MEHHDVASFCQDAFESLLTSMIGSKEKPAKTHGQVLLRFLRIAPACDAIYPLGLLQQEYLHHFAKRCDQLGLMSGNVLSEGGSTDDNQAWNVSFELAAMSTNYALGDILSQRLFSYLPVWRRIQLKLATAQANMKRVDSTKSSMQYINSTLSQKQQLVSDVKSL